MDSYVTRRKASLIAGVNPHQILMAAVRGQVRTQVLPGMNVRYNAEDSRRLRGGPSARREA